VGLRVHVQDKELEVEVFTLLTRTPTLLTRIIWPSMLLRMMMVMVMMVMGIAKSR